MDEHAIVIAQSAHTRRIGGNRSLLWVAARIVALARQHLTVVRAPRTRLLIASRRKRLRSLVHRRRTHRTHSTMMVVVRMKHPMMRMAIAVAIMPRTSRSVAVRTESVGGIGVDGQRELSGERIDERSELALSLVLSPKPTATLVHRQSPQAFALDPFELPAAEGSTNRRRRRKVMRMVVVAMMSRRKNVDGRRRIVDRRSGRSNDIAYALSHLIDRVEDASLTSRSVVRRTTVVARRIVGRIVLTKCTKPWRQWVATHVRQGVHCARDGIHVQLVIEPFRAMVVVAMPPPTKSVVSEIRHRLFASFAEETLSVER